MLLFFAFFRVFPGDLAFQYSIWIHHHFSSWAPFRDILTFLIALGKYFIFMKKEDMSSKKRMYGSSTK